MNDPHAHSDPQPDAPGPADLDHTEPPPQPVTQPSVEARPDLLPPAPSAPGSQYAPGPYALGPPPMPLPPKPKRTGTLLLAVLVAVLMIAGGVAGYVLLGDGGEKTGTIGEDSEAEETTTETAGPHETPSELEFSGETIPVESLGAQMPVPSENWQLQAGPGEDGADIDDMASYAIEYDPGWYANILVGRYNVAQLPFDPATMDATAAELTSFWTARSADNGVDATVTEPKVTELTVGGRAAVLGEATASWDSTEYSPDKYERVVIFLVDVDGVNAFYVQAWIPESADAEYEALIAALEATTFTA
ncbi:MAG TPA: hypothetical protein VHG10_02680 [Glycomyces sp.]|nr:hypothetical protein [Glycomyces sp.]